MSDLALKNATIEEQTRQLFQVFPVASVIGSLLAVLLAYFAKDEVPGLWVLSWLGLFFLVMIFRFAVYWKYINNTNVSEKAAQSLRLFSIGTAGHGICWSLGVIIFLPQMSITNQALSNVLFAGVAAGAISSLSYHFSTITAYISLILIPIVITMAFTDTGLAYISIMAGLFLVSLLVAAKRFNESFTNNVRMRFEADIANKIQQESSKRLELLFGGSPLSIVEWDTDLNITDWNPSAQKVFDYAKDEILGKSLLILVPSPQHDEMKRFTYDLLLRKKNINRHIECIDKSGNAFPTEWFATTVLTDNYASESKFAAQINDISDMEKAKHAAESKEQRYEYMLRHVPAVIYVCKVLDDSYPAVYVSGNMKELFGYTPEQYLNNPEFWISNVHPDDKERVLNNFQKLFEFDSHVHDYRFRMPDGHYEWVRDELRLLRDEKGKPTEFIGSWIKYEDSKNAFLALERFKNILDLTMDCVFMFDAKELRFTYGNKGAYLQIGYTEPELKRIHPYDIKPEYTEEDFRALIKPLLDGTESRLSFETVHQHKNGSLIPVEVFLQYIELENEPGSFVAIVRDISERRKMEKVKDEFLSTISHELRTPVTSVLGALGLIKSDLPAHPDCSDSMLKLVDIAYNNSQRLARLINDVIDMDKISNGLLEVITKPTHIMPVVKQGIDENTHYAEQLGVHFRLIEEEMGDTMAYVDENRLNQVLSNLLTNAAKYTHTGDEIEICVSSFDERVRIAITDHGRGIPENVGNKVFERFVRVDSTDTRVGGGSGLGLSICKYLVEKMGGEIGFFPNTEKPGVTFFVEFPEKKNRGA